MFSDFAFIIILWRCWFVVFQTDQVNSAALNRLPGFTIIREVLTAWNCGTSSPIA
jgi:hypothetical protein